MFRTMVLILGMSLPAAVVAFLTFFHTMQFGFTLDDEVSVNKNLDVVDPSSPLSLILTNDFWGRPLSLPNSHQSYRPLTTLSYRLDRHRAKLIATLHPSESKPPYRTLALSWHAFDDPKGIAHVFHQTNVGLHALSSATLAVFCYVTLGVTPAQAAWTGILFAVHPVHVEGVASITGRGEMLGFLFTLWAMMVDYRGSYLRQTRSTSWIQAFGRALWGFLTMLLRCVLFIAAALCKETALPLFITPLLTILWVGYKKYDPALDTHAEKQKSKEDQDQTIRGEQINATPAPDQSETNQQIKEKAEKDNQSPVLLTSPIKGETNMKHGQETPSPEPQVKEKDNQATDKQKPQPDETATKEEANENANKPNRTKRFYIIKQILTSLLWVICTIFTIVAVILLRRKAGAGTGAPSQAFEYIGSPLHFEGKLPWPEPTTQPHAKPIHLFRGSEYFPFRPLDKVLHYDVQPWANLQNVTMGVPIKTQLLSSVELIGIYLVKLFVAPFQQGRVYVYDYSWPTWTPLRDFNNHWHPRVVNALIVLVPAAVYILSTVVLSFRNPSYTFPMFWIFWLGLSLVLPSHLLVKIGTTHADRLAYMPSATACALFIQSIFFIQAKMKNKNVGESIAIALGGIIIGMWALSAYKHSEDWRNNETLYLSGLDSPSRDSSRVMFNGAGSLGQLADKHARNNHTLTCEIKMNVVDLYEKVGTQGPAEPLAWKWAFQRLRECGQWQRLEKAGHTAFTVIDCHSAYTRLAPDECMSGLIEVANDFIGGYHQTVPPEFHPKRAKKYGSRLDALLFFAFNHRNRRDITKKSTLLKPDLFLPNWRGEVNGVDEVCLVRGIGCPTWKKKFKDIGHMT